MKAQREEKDSTVSCQILSCKYPMLALLNVKGMLELIRRARSTRHLSSCLRNSNDKEESLLLTTHEPCHYCISSLHMVGSFGRIFRAGGHLPSFLLIKPFKVSTMVLEHPVAKVINGNYTKEVYKTSRFPTVFFVLSFHFFFFNFKSFATEL